MELNKEAKVPETQSEELVAISEMDKKKEFEATLEDINS